METKKRREDKKKKLGILNRIFNFNMSNLFIVIFNNRIYG